MRQQTPPAGPTVGDTIWVSRSVAVPAGYAVRPNGWTLSGAVELLGQPSVERVGDSTRVRYPLVAWDPGPHTVVVPGPILIAPGGAEDTLPPQSLAFTVQSVLPRGVADSAIPIQPRVGVVVRGEATPIPLLVALVVATGLVFLIRWWRGRPGKVKSPGEAVMPPAVPGYEAWHLSGEDRAVVACSAQSLRQRIAELCGAAGVELPTEQLLLTLAHERPKWPLADLSAVLSALDVARFSTDDDDPLAIARRATELESRLTGPSA
jgi:hypothetical protein